MNLLFDRDFSDVYRSYVVLANPKTVLHDRGADSVTRSQVIRADQLTAVIKAVNDERGPGHEKTFRSATRDLAEWFLAQHKDNPVDYVAKYRAMQEQREDRQVEDSAVFCPRCGSPMVLRTAKKGARAGKRFYGCSTYPACRGIVNVEE